MSLVERINAVLMTGCAVSIDIEQVPPTDLLAIARAAVARNVKVTFRNALKKAPDTLTQLAGIGVQRPDLFTFEF